MLHIRGAMEYRFAQQDINGLPSLRQLKVDFDWDFTDIRGSPSSLLEALESRFNSSGMGMFVLSKLKTVEIKVELMVWHLDVEAVMEQEGQLIEWVEIKRMLLLSRP